MHSVHASQVTSVSKVIMLSEVRSITSCHHTLSIQFVHSSDEEALCLACGISEGEVGCHTVVA